jgi:hypothetical protein
LVKYHEDFEKNVKNKPLIHTVQADTEISHLQQRVNQNDYQKINQIQQQPHQLKKSNEKLPISRTSHETINTILPIKPRKLIASQNAVVSSSIDSSSFSTTGTLERLQQQQQQTMQPTYSTGNLYHPQPKTMQNFSSVSNINHNNHHQFSSQITNNYINNRVIEHSRDDYHHPNHNNRQIEQQAINQHSMIKTSVFRAIYDYDANDSDELSFRDGDKFINCEEIAQGWMLGIHEKSGKRGLFPSNYCTAIDYF